jgi:hypothetical protein
MFNRSIKLYRIWLDCNEHQRDSIYKSFRRKAIKSNTARKLKKIWKNIHIHNRKDIIC